MMAFASQIIRISDVRERTIDLNPDYVFAFVVAFVLWGAVSASVIILMRSR